MRDEGGRWWGRAALTRQPSFPWALIAAFCLVPLLGMAYVGTFSRYLADDYCTAGVLRSNGFWDGLAAWYVGWSGRFSYIFLMQVLHLFGPGVTSLATALLLLLWIAGILLLLRNLLQKSGIAVSWTAIAALGATLLLATAVGAPDRYQSFYWQTGLVTYVAPLVLLTFYAAWLVARWGRTVVEARLPVAEAASFVIAFAAGGFSEVSVSAQLVLLAISLVCARLFLPPAYRRKTIIVLGAGLAGTIAAIVVILLAPGNQVRLAQMPERSGLTILLLSTGRFAAAFVAKSLLRSPGVALLAVMIPFVFALGQPTAVSVGGGKRRSPILSIGIPLAAALIVVVISIFPAVYATSAYPAERSLVVTQYVLVWGLAGTGYLASRRLRESRLGESAVLRRARLFTFAILVIVLTVSLVGAKDVLDFVPEARSYAEQWDHRYAQVLGAGNVEGALAIAPLPHMGGLAEVGEDPAEWINACVAAAYALEAVVAK